MLKTEVFCMLKPCSNERQNGFKLFIYLFFYFFLRFKPLKIFTSLATALVLIQSRHGKREKNKKEEKGVSGADLYLLIEQLAMLIKALY